MAKTKRLIICTYHRKTDYEEITQTLIENDYHTWTSKGYMIYAEFIAGISGGGAGIWYSPPYLRRGVIRAVKMGQTIPKHEKRVPVFNDQIISQYNPACSHSVLEKQCN
ncbi:MAG: hypothetical protein Ta2B_10730 [Termitinemataceae bacterium]|nr:MAG: hypothetical protein Ta2B_10730 [Termitinemataceae bacterium]